MTNYNSSETGFITQPPAANFPESAVYTALNQPLTDALKWLYSRQPDPRSALSPAGITFQSALPGKIGLLKVCPVGYHSLPMIVIASKNNSEWHNGCFNLSFQEGSQFYWEEIRTFELLVGDLNCRIAKIILGGGRWGPPLDFIIFLLSDPSHPSLIRAVENSLPFCIKHKSYNCCERCFSSQDSFKKLLIPNNWA